MCARGPVLSRGAQIGTNATLLPFVVIGAYSLVGAGSVVTRDVPSGTVVAGNPARVLKNTSDVRCPLDLPDGGYLRARAGKAELA
jgi:acetyltransferase-like isoleucine patch superfamily enzyme